MTFSLHYITLCVLFCLETRLLKAIVQRWNIHSVPGCRILHLLALSTGNKGDIGFTLPFRLKWHGDIKERQGHVRCVQPLGPRGNSAGKSTVWYAEDSLKKKKKGMHTGNKKMQSRGISRQRVIYSCGPFGLWVRKRLLFYGWCDRKLLRDFLHWSGLVCVYVCSLTFTVLFCKVRRRIHFTHDGDNFHFRWKCWERLFIATEHSFDDILS